MNTTGPTTRAAFALLEFRDSSPEMNFSGLRFLDGDNPADPLVARQRRNVSPRRPRRLIGSQRFS